MKQTTPVIGTMIGAMLGLVLGLALCVYLGWSLGSWIVTAIGMTGFFAWILKVMVMYYFVKTVYGLVARFTTLTGALTGLIGGSFAGKLHKEFKSTKPKTKDDVIDVKAKRVE